MLLATWSDCAACSNWPEMAIDSDKVYVATSQAILAVGKEGQPCGGSVDPPCAIAIDGARVLGPTATFTTHSVSQDGGQLYWLAVPSDGYRGIFECPKDGTNQCNVLLPPETLHKAIHDDALQVTSFVTTPDTVIALTNGSAAILEVSK